MIDKSVRAKAVSAYACGLEVKATRAELRADIERRQFSTPLISKVTCITWGTRVGIALFAQSGSEVDLC